MLVLSDKGNAQAIPFCGTLPTNTATSTNPDSILYDRFGNSYDIYEFEENYDRGAFSAAGYFQLEYTTDITDDFREVIQKVFLDLAGIIPQRILTTSCDENILPKDVVILIRPLSDGPTSSLASASHVFGADFEGALCDHVVPNNAQNRINGGRKINTFDGLMSIRLNPSTVLWNFDYNNATTSGYVDLYSVVLHEALHILGFASNLGLDALPVFSQPLDNNNIYSKWDDLLYVTTEYDENGMSSNVSKVLESTCSDHCRSLNSTVFPTGSAFNDAVEKNCSTSGSLDFMIGENGIAPIWGGGSGTPGSVVNSLSHLNDDCNGHGEDYVMQGTIHPATDRRQITATELDILCELGYDVTGCNKCYLTSINTPTDLNYYGVPYFGSDEYNCCPRNYFVCVGEELIIPFEDLLCDKFSNGEMEIIDAYSTIFDPLNPGEYTRGDEAEISGETVIISPLSASDDGRFFLNYEIKTCDCVIERFVTIIRVGECLECTSTDICDNLVCTQGFEEMSDLDENNSLSYFEQIGGGYHIYEGNDDNGFGFCKDNTDNTYVYLLNEKTNNSLTKNGISFKLSHPIQPGCTATISFKANSRQFNTAIEILGSEMPPCYFLDSKIKHGCQPTVCGDYTYNPICIENMNIAGVVPFATTNCSSTPNLTAITPITWVNEEDFPVNYIMLSANPVNNFEYPIYLDDFEVTNACPVDACFDFIVDCKTVNFESCYDEGFQHQWIFGDGNSSTESNPTHEYTSNGTYQVRHNIRDLCDNSTDYVIHEVVIDCVENSCVCDAVGSYNINAGAGELLSDLISASTVPATTINNKCISILGKLIVDVPYNIYSSEIKMQAGSEIEIINGGRLNLLDVDKDGGIHGCDFMWKGISVQENGYLTLSNSIIQDAHHAVTLHDDSYHYITTTLFNKNYIGIFIPPAISGLNTINQPYPFRGNTFNCDGEDCLLLSPYEGQPILIGNKPYAGILANNTTLIVGSLLSGSQYRNYFYEVANGIISLNSTLTSYKARFETLYPASSLGGAKNRAIISSESRMKIEENYIKLKARAFQSSSDLATSFSWNRIDNCYEGLIYSNTGLFKYDIIQNNEIDYKLIGISNSFQKNRLSVSENDLTKNSSATTLSIGIRILTPSPYSQISNNKFSLDYRNSGISVNSGIHTTIKDNELINSYDPQGVSTFGFEVLGGRNNVIAANTIDESAISNHLSTGISISGSPSNLICCNEISAGTGLGFYGMNDNTILKTNDLTGYKSYGLRIPPSTFIGSQPHRGNKWAVGSLTPFIADASHAGTDNEIFMSRFQINTCSAPLWPGTISPGQDCDSEPDNWFLQTSGSFYACGVINDCPPSTVIIFEDHFISQNDLDYIDGALNSSYYANMLKWEKGKHLYRRIYLDTALINYNSAVTDFYTTASANSMGKLVELERGIDSINHIPELIRDTLEMIEVAMDDELNLIRQTDSLLAIATTSVDSLDLSEDRITSIQEINTLFGQLNTIKSSLQVQKNLMVDSLIAVNNSIAMTHLIDFMEKYVYKVYLETIAKDTLNFNPAQKTNLYNIARECPMEFGTVVYRARGIYSLIEDIEYDDSECMGEDDIMPLKREQVVEEQNKNEIKLLIMPNPNKGQFELAWTYEGENENYLMIEIISLQGTTIRKEKVPAVEGKLQIDLSAYAAGMYMVRILQDGMLLDVKKVLVLK